MMGAHADGTGLPRAPLSAARALFAAAAAVLAAASASEACPSCWGNPDSPVAAAMNSGIFFLLGLTAVVLGWFVAIIFTIRHRTKQWEARKAALKVVNLGGPARLTPDRHA